MAGKHGGVPMHLKMCLTVFVRYHRMCQSSTCILADKAVAVFCFVDSSDFISPRGEMVIITIVVSEKIKIQKNI